MDNVNYIENLLIPFGRIALLGAGRLGIRVMERIVMTHRGGFKKISVYDGGTIEENDFYHIDKGAIPKENKASFLKRKFLTPDTRQKEIEAVPFNFSKEEIKLLKNADTVVSTIAGGDTLPLIAEIGNFCELNAIPFITTNGVFGFGDEEISICRKLKEIKKGPALFLKKYNFPEETEQIRFIGTGILIEEKLPISPIILEKIADMISTEVLKSLYGRKDGKNY